MRKIDADALLERWEYHFDHCKSLEECIKTQPTVDDWILCSERLPEICEQVLVSQMFDSGETNVTTASRIYPLGSKNRWFWCAYDHKIRHVVAWKPLPKPYGK